MSQDYIVIFELTAVNGGSAFIRTRTDYESEHHFREVYYPDPRETVVGEGVPEDIAQILLTGSPSICYLLHTVEEGCQSGMVDWDLLEMNLVSLLRAVESIKSERQKLNVTYSAPVGLQAHLDTLRGQKSDKGRLMRAFIDAYDVDTDSLDIHQAHLNLLKTIIDITIPEY